MIGLTLNWNKIYQGLLGAGQVLNLWGGFLPIKYQVPIAAVLAGASYTVSVLAHKSNTDGTPQFVAYVPKTGEMVTAKVEVDTVDPVTGKVEPLKPGS